jgi:zinc protease
LFLSGVSALGASSALVEPSVIARQKSLTRLRHLPNGVPVILRHVEGSKLVHVQVGFQRGLRDLPAGRRTMGRWVAATMTREAQGFPREKVYELTARYGIDLGCSSGIEASSCAVGVVRDYWTTALPLFAALVLRPTLSGEDLALTRDRLLAQMRQVPSDPSGYVNEIVNSVYYPPSHPYFTPFRLEMEELSKAPFAWAREEHEALIRTAPRAIVVVSGLAEKTVMGALTKAFGKTAVSPAPRVNVTDPEFSREARLAIETRQVPNAYVHMKFNIPGVASAEAPATQLMLSVLSERLFEELRTKRSLSYSAYAYPRFYSVGIGVMGSSTSNPRATMEGIAAMVARMRREPLGQEELWQYKMGFATSYFQTQESHASLAQALMGSFFDWGSTDALYDFPRRVEALTPEDVRRSAERYLKDFRMGLIASPAEADRAWFERFLREKF